MGACAMPGQEVTRARRDEHATAEREVIQLANLEQLGSRIDEWRDLAARIEGSSYFQTPDWVLTWWEDAGRPPASGHARSRSSGGSAFRWPLEQDPPHSLSP